MDSHILFIDNKIQAFLFSDFVNQKSNLLVKMQNNCKFQCKSIILKVKSNKQSIYFNFFMTKQHCFKRRIAIFDSKL